MLAAAGSLIVPGEVSPTGLQLREGLSVAEWQAVGRSLGKFISGGLWWIGDWCDYGEGRYGATYAAALAETGLSYQTVAKASYVARRFEFFRRRKNLSWSHHAEVASLEPPEADRWLDHAYAAHWSQKRLRAEIKAARQIEAAGIGDGGNAAHDHGRVLEHVIVALQGTANESRHLNVALLAGQPDAPLWLARLEDALNVLNRLYGALKQATGGDAAGTHNASPHPEEHHHGDQQDPAGRVPFKEVVT
jgi:hypothetical protein